MRQRSVRSPKTSKKGKEREHVEDHITTAWWECEQPLQTLLGYPPDLRDHPSGLQFDDIFYDRVGNKYRLWLWVDVDGSGQWLRVDCGHERASDGMVLALVRDAQHPSWVTAAYYARKYTPKGAPDVL